MINSKIFTPKFLLSSYISYRFFAHSSSNSIIIFFIPCGFGIKKTKQELNNYLKKNKSFSTLKAYKNNKLFIGDGNQFFNRPGPRLVESIEILAEIMHPEAFNFKHKNEGWINYSD